ncbi:protein of unknown function DUF81 [Rhodomicrobium vannielii ATCC 17100]|uniref:Probable membrane transporter protein n=1 Tax=Rhodomicrobium vannielii (strain ATCC 17100 / DSM 162 / LMG 4299 / NCIMB 10020 / ATH 3.1.1) TaxID=648757 RepID=E3I346_RHOVT|nr:sulfite exporter TauE/SafE family protein [Rhodomicrobium vannielii]ADP70340.1 protein of unknown function DUF81 [Rhodomicrobium vannielii ATCC 17100]
MTPFDWVLLAAVGCISGLSAGLLGIGGGLVVVPSLIYGLPLLGISGPDVPKIATATSLALVIPTALASAQAHAAKGAVCLRCAALLAPALIAGAFLATMLAPFLDARMIVAVFVLYAIVFTWGVLRPERARAAATPDRLGAKRLAETALKSVSGGALAALLGFGGAFFCVPILSRFVSMKKAIGTASALGLPLAAAGVAGYLLAPSPEGCSTACAGAIFMPAIGVASVLTAPVGARLAHSLPVALLKRVFAVLLLLTAASLTLKITPQIPRPAPHLKAALLRLAEPVCRDRAEAKLSLQGLHRP